jgi:hypothetical protein
MWGWTKMGARVFVTPGEVSAPAAFSHPFLAAYKVAPQPVVAEPPTNPDAKVGPKADLGAPEIKSIETKLDLRPSVGHDKPADATRTADAGGKVAVTMTDAGGGTPRSDAKIENTDAAGNASTKGGETTGEAKPEVAEAAKHDEAAPEQKLADTKSAMAPETGAMPEVAAKAEGDDAKPEHAATAEVKAEEKPEARVEKAAEAPKAVEPVKPVEAKTEPRTEPKAAETQKVETKPDAVKADVAKPDDAKAAKKDETRIAPPVKVVKESPRRTGQIAVFISGKDSKLYVRQNFAPLFDVPVTIASSDRPLGTHVFTAQVDKEDSNALHWSVVNVPMHARAARGEDKRERVASRGKHKGAPPPPPVEVKQIMVDSPAEALDRITVPPEAMARIAEALATGGSIIVADQSIKQGETGEYTDFILSLR